MALSSNVCKSCSGVDSLARHVTLWVALSSTLGRPGISVICTGFDPRYVGTIRYARNLEAIAELWIHLGIPAITTAERWGRDYHFQVLSKP